ncbi:MAG: hypothetical protein V4565_01540 [Bacteroidota bacterium]
MKELDSYEEKLINVNELKNSISELIKYSIDSKKFKFEKSEFQFDISLLEANEVLVGEESKLIISESALYYSEFFSHYSSHLKFELTEDINEAFDFISRIEEELKIEQPFNTNVYSFFKGFKSFVLFLVYKKFNTDFSAFIKTLNKESGSILYDFNYTYAKLVPFLNTPTDVLYNNLNHLIIGVTSDVQYNSNLYEISNSIREFCKKNPEDGKKLLQYGIEQPTILHNLIIPALGGLYEDSRDVFWNEIAELVKKPELRVSVICSLSFTHALTNEEANKYYSTITIIGNYIEEELFNLPKFFISIINNKVIDDESLKESCFLKLNELIINPNQKLRQVILNELSFVDGYDSKCIKVLRTLIEDEYFDKEQIGLVGHVFIRNKDLLGFIELITVYGERFKLDFKAENFSSALYNFRQDFSENLSKELIKLLTHDSGAIRYIGVRIIEYLTPHNGRFIFQTDILNCEAITQYKLWMSIIGEIKEPKYTLPMMFPLLNSSFSFVKEAFICRMEQLTEEYGSSVLETMEAELDLTKLDYTSIYTRIKKYSDDFWAEISRKRGIKELNPLYTQSDLYTLFSNNYGKSFNKNLSEGVEKKSFFMQFATTIILAKGGGWKHEKKGKVEKLGQVSTSFQLPRSHFVNPESFDWEFRTNYFENWKNKFKKWEAVISS